MIIPLRLRKLLDEKALVESEIDHLWLLMSILTSKLSVRQKEWEKINNKVEVIMPAGTSTAKGYYGKKRMAASAKEKKTPTTQGKRK